MYHQKRFRNHSYRTVSFKYNDARTLRIIVNECAHPYHFNKARAFVYRLGENSSVAAHKRNNHTNNRNSVTIAPLISRHSQLASSRSKQQANNRVKLQRKANERAVESFRNITNNTLTRHFYARERRVQNKREQWSGKDSRTIQTLTDRQRQVGRPQQSLAIKAG